MEPSSIEARVSKYGVLTIVLAALAAKELALKSVRYSH
jgi:hypothetical protein